MRTVEQIKSECLSQSEIKAINTIFQAVDNIPLDRLREMCEAEREQRCVVLPVKDKSTVSCLNGDGGAYDCYVNGIMCLRDNDPMMRATAELSDGSTYEHIVARENIGKTVFLTRSEAGAALQSTRD